MMLLKHTSLRIKQYEYECGLDMLRAYRKDMEQLRKDKLRLAKRVVELESELATIKAQQKTPQRP